MGTSEDPDEMADHMSHLISLHSLCYKMQKILMTANSVIVLLRKRELVALPVMGNK